MSDIVARLLEEYALAKSDTSGAPYCNDPDLLMAAVDEINRLRAWNKIATAPKEPWKPIVLWAYSRPNIRSWSDSWGGCWMNEYCNGPAEQHFNPTHWFALPDAAPPNDTP